ncbi:nucleotidyl transferase family protein [Anthocerotibacter panamensis]|uniref:hypothetical protein n=1 Tax=Anthocerotibacter panamensis TaxID=2857077 RepID=UPI001C406D71|nr:hypothetical protein [Anthocerotibacter panamensis]
MAPDIALYGLSADPPHRGHAQVMALLAQHFSQVWVWAVDNPLKRQGMAPLMARQQMVALTVSHLGLDNLHHRPEFTSPWTAESVAIIHFLCPQYRLWVALGSDALQQVPEWLAVELLIARSHGFVEVTRAGKSTGLTRLLGLPVRSLEADIPPYASHTLRAQLARTEGPEALLPEVYTYIRSQGLYTDQGAEERLQMPGQPASLEAQ